jgi:hypothetical protein
MELGIILKLLLKGKFLCYFDLQSIIIFPNSKLISEDDENESFFQEM